MASNGCNNFVHLYVRSCKVKPCILLKPVSSEKGFISCFVRFTMGIKKIYIFFILEGNCFFNGWHASDNCDINKTKNKTKMYFSVGHAMYLIWSLQFLSHYQMSVNYVRLWFVVKSKAILGFCYLSLELIIVQVITAVIHGAAHFSSRN